MRSQDSLQRYKIRVRYYRISSTGWNLRTDDGTEWCDVHCMRSFYAHREENASCKLAEVLASSYDMYWTLNFASALCQPLIELNFCRRGGISSHITFVFRAETMRNCNNDTGRSINKAKTKERFFSVWYVSACLMKSRLFENKSEKCFQLE
jgi:hypothetical protein